MRCAIMQPTYIPWAGYFNLISSVDRFIFLDNVQHERRSWQMRNRIVLNGKETLLTIPLKKCSQSTLLKDVLISDDISWKSKHWDTLCLSYKNAPYGRFILDLLAPHYESCKSRKSLSCFTQAIIVSIANSLGLSTQFFNADDLTSEGGRSDRLAALCRAASCDAYLSPLGSKKYLEDDQFTEKHKISLEFQEFQVNPYNQFKSDLFISHLSIVDVIANMGPVETFQYIKTSA